MALWHSSYSMLECSVGWQCGMSNPCKRMTGDRLSDVGYLETLIMTFLLIPASPASRHIPHPCCIPAAVLVVLADLQTGIKPCTSLPLLFFPTLPSSILFFNSTAKILARFLSSCSYRLSCCTNWAFLSLISRFLPVIKPVQ